MRWHAPQRNWFKLNTNGAYKKHPNGIGLEGVFKDHTGRWILGFQKKYVANSPLHVELQAIYQGLQIATKFDLLPLEVEIDSTEAINALNHDHVVFSNIVYAYRSLMPHQKALLLRHNLCERNKVAHLLAKDATNEQYKQLNPEVSKLHAGPPYFGMQQLTSEQSGECLFVKSLPTTFVICLGQ